MVILTVADVVAVHEFVINPGELPGLAKDKSLEAALFRIENRLRYGLIKDVYDLAATYAVVIAVGHVFNDANKRTAYRTMTLCLELNGIELSFETEEIGQIIIRVAQGLVDEVELARFLRSKSH